ncbi:MAG: hypothetical protein SGJ21_09510 [Alphaproteobacteria bacterium]|nr:hypothetical protein [Alphaproteobacteria bacterium]
MTFKTIASLVVLAAATASCQSIPREQTVGQYCSNASNINRDVCKVNVEIDGQRQALAQTNMTLSEARAVANDALSRANAAQQTANAAQQQANAAISPGMNCMTNTVQRSKVGSCAPAYKLVSCTQTRFTTRSGGMSIMREIDDTQCRFNDQVLEMQIRCCTAGAPVGQTEISAPLSEPAAPTRPNPAS